MFYYICKFLVDSTTDIICDQLVTFILFCLNMV